MSQKQHFAIDLDGTLLSYDGWKGEDHFGEPLAGAVEWVKKRLEDGHEITVFTTRTAFDKVHDALVARGFPSLPVSNVKSPKFSCFIDDRAVSFDGPEDWAYLTVDDFEPWWKGA